jgi:hypothetical protein
VRRRSLLWAVVAANVGLQRRPTQLDAMARQPHAQHPVAMVTHFLVPLQCRFHNPNPNAASRPVSHIRALKQYRRNFYTKHADEYVRVQKGGARRGSKSSRRGSKSSRSSISSVSSSARALQAIAEAERIEQEEWEEVCKLAAKPPKQPAWNAGPNWRPPCERYCLRLPVDD